jgi:hypothetical protein
MKARWHVYGLFVSLALALAGCTLLRQVDTTAERLAAGYSAIAGISIIAANDLDAAVRKMQIVNDDLTRAQVQAELERATRVQRAVEAAREVLTIADTAYVNGAVIEAGMYLSVVDQLLAELEALQQ